MSSQFEDVNCNDSVIYQEYYKSNQSEIFTRQNFYECGIQEFKEQYPDIPRVGGVSSPDIHACSFLSQRPSLVIFVGDMATFPDLADQYAKLSSALEEQKIQNEEQHPYNRVHQTSCIMIHCVNDVDIANLVPYHLSLPWHERTKQRLYLSAFAKTLTEQQMLYTHDLLVALAHTGCAFSTVMKHATLRSTIQWGASLDPEEYVKSQHSLDQAHNVYLGRQGFFSNARPPLRQWNAPMCTSLANIGFPVPFGYLGDSGDIFTLQSDPPRLLLFIVDMLLLVGSIQLSYTLLSKAVVQLRDRNNDIWGIARVTWLQYKYALQKDLHHGYVPVTLAEDQDTQVHAQTELLEQGEDLMFLRNRTQATSFRDVVLLSQYNVTNLEQQKGVCGAAMPAKRTEGTPFDYKNPWIRRLLSRIQYPSPLQYKSGKHCIDVYTSIQLHDNLEKSLPTELSILLHSECDEAFYNTHLRAASLSFVGKAENQTLAVSKAQQEVLNTAIKCKQGSFVMTLLPHIVTFDCQMLKKSVWHDILALISAQPQVQRVLTKLWTQLVQCLKRREITDIARATVHSVHFSTVQSPLQPIIASEVGNVSKLSHYCLLFPVSLPRLTTPQPIFTPQTKYILENIAEYPIQRICSASSISKLAFILQLIKSQPQPEVFVFCLNIAGMMLCTQDLQTQLQDMTKSHSMTSTVQTLTAENWLFCNDMSIKNVAPITMNYMECLEYQELLTRMTFMDFDIQQNIKGLDISHNNDNTATDSEEEDVFVPEGMAPIWEEHHYLLPPSSMKLMKNTNTNLMTVEYTRANPKALYSKIMQEHPNITQQMFSSRLTELCKLEFQNVCLRNALLSTKLTNTVISVALLGRVLNIPEVLENTVSMHTIVTNNTNAPLQITITSIQTTLLLTTNNFIFVDQELSQVKDGQQRILPLLQPMTILIPSMTSLVVPVEFAVDTLPPNSFVVITSILTALTPLSSCHIALPITTHTQCSYTLHLPVDAVYQYPRPKVTDCLTLLPTISELQPYRATMFLCNVANPLEQRPNDVLTPISNSLFQNIPEPLDLQFIPIEEILTQNSVHSVQNTPQNSLSSSHQNINLYTLQRPNQSIPHPQLITRLLPAKRTVKIVLSEVPKPTEIKKKKVQNRFHTFTKGDITQAQEAHQHSVAYRTPATLINSNSTSSITHTPTDQTFNYKRTNSMQTISSGTPPNPPKYVHYLDSHPYSK